ncbi:MAG: beta-ketoacyl-[acyl-carrier-protein] synthase family protein [Candidatus Omnitrophota bacterium]|nr:MAG: beta-ketoacyl-[acyl-carrier-protein] synthase family protein [Candidatus Omnitrophota bacterium]
MKKKRVVVTGLGIIAPSGIGLDKFWHNISRGNSAVKRVDNFDVSQFNSRIAAQVEDFIPHNFGLSEAERMDRYVQFALVAAKMAVEDASLDFNQERRERLGVILANAICGTKYMEEEFLRVTDNGKLPIDPRLVRPDLYDASMFNTPSSEISNLYKLNGACLTVSTGCTAGTDSVGLSMEMIQDGKQDIIITGASEAPITPITFGAFDVVNVLSTINDEPHKASRPFDARRNGFVISEGCGILILEELEHARKRGAKIYAEIIGYGTCNNAFHMTDLPADGEAMADCITLALEDAGVEPKKIGYINAHGSSTRQNDVFETSAYKKVFGDYAYKIPTSSLKSMFGHPLAAANAVELVACGLIFKNNFLPPTINQEVPDPNCDLDYIPNQGREGRPEYILKTSSGFSGIHSSMVLKRWEEN